MGHGVNPKRSRRRAVEHKEKLTRINGTTEQQTLPPSIPPAPFPSDRHPASLPTKPYWDQSSQQQQHQVQSRITKHAGSRKAHHSISSLKCILPQRTVRCREKLMQISTHYRVKQAEPTAFCHFASLYLIVTSTLIHSSYIIQNGLIQRLLLLYKANSTISQFLHILSIYLSIGLGIG